MDDQATDHDEADIRFELESHADTTCVSPNAYILYKTNKTVQLTGFSTELGSIHHAPIVGAAYAYDDPITDQTFLLYFHQAILVKSLEHPLLCPMQARYNDIIVSECPKHLMQQPSNYHHALMTNDMEGHQVIIPLSLHGTTPYFPVRTPTTQELEDCKILEITANTPDWNPRSPNFAARELCTMDDWIVPEQHILQQSIMATTPTNTTELIGTQEFIRRMCGITTSPCQSLDHHLLAQ